jgi:hypothetical protein
MTRPRVQKTLIVTSLVLVGAVTACATTREVIAHGAFRVETLDLSAPGAHDTMWYRASITNTSDSAAALVLDLRSVAGQWSPLGSHRAFTFTFAPREQRQIAAWYMPGRLTIETALRVTYRTPRRDSQPPGLEDAFFLRWYPVGAGNASAVNLGAGFVEKRTQHLLLLAAPRTPAARDLDRLAQQREAAIGTISDVLAADFRGHVRMVFYPDSATKAKAIGHIGMGLAFDRNIVEIYTDSARLDPFHELTHIVAEGQGSPPAVFDEGLATYMTERLGADALEHLGHPKTKIGAAVCELYATHRFIPLDSILHYAEIGPPGTFGEITYPEAASFVQYLVETRGLPQFRAAYRRVERASDSARWRANATVLHELYGMSVQELEKSWLSSLHCP